MEVSRRDPVGSHGLTATMPPTRAKCQLVAPTHELAARPRVRKSTQRKITKLPFDQPDHSPFRNSGVRGASLKTQHASRQRPPGRRCCRKLTRVNRGLTIHCAIKFGARNRSSPCPHRVINPQHWHLMKCQRNQLISVGTSFASSSDWSRLQCSASPSGSISAITRRQSSLRL